MVRVLFCSWLVFMWMLPVATAIQRGAPKINACILCVRVLCKTRRSFIRSFSRLSLDASYLWTGVKGCSKIRRVLAKPRLIIDEMCRLYGKFASYLRRVLCKTRLFFSSYKWPYCAFPFFSILFSVISKRFSAIRQPTEPRAIKLEWL